MTQDEYDKVEAPALMQLQQLGWRYRPGAALAPEAVGQERAYYRDVVLTKQLERRCGA